MNLVVPSVLDGERIDRVIATLTGLTRSAVVDAIANGRVRIDGDVVDSKSQVVTSDDDIDIDLPSEEDLLPDADADVVFDVVFADDDIAVINKPAGLVVHPGAGNPDKTLVNGLLSRFPAIDENRPGESHRPGIVHRLDAGTTGLLVVAMHEESHARLVEALKARQVARRYKALAWGHVRPEAGEIDAPIGRAQRHRTRMAVSVKGKVARTSYKVIGMCEKPEVTYVDAKLETGRTHQVRVHFAAIGHPLVGDRRYNGYRQSLSFDRPFLHAASLSFNHPMTGETLDFEAPLPADMTGVLNKLALTTAFGE